VPHWRVFVHRSSGVTIERARFPDRALDRRKLIEPSATKGAIRKIGVLGNHLPRHCGSRRHHRLTDALSAERTDVDCVVLAMNDAGSITATPSPRPLRDRGERPLASYRRAADFLNVNTVDVVSVQHEYGIFGGKSALTSSRSARAAHADRHDAPQPSSPSRAGAAARDGRS